MGFVNSFISYFLLVIIFCIAAGAAVALGIVMRKRKNLQTPVEESTENGKME